MPQGHSRGARGPLSPGLPRTDPNDAEQAGRKQARPDDDHRSDGIKGSDAAGRSRFLDSISSTPFRSNRRTRFRHPRSWGVNFTSMTGCSPTCEARVGPGRPLLRSGPRRKRLVTVARPIDPRSEGSLRSLSRDADREVSHLRIPIVASDRSERQGASTAGAARRPSKSPHHRQLDRLHGDIRLTARRTCL